MARSLAERVLPKSTLVAIEKVLMANNGQRAKGPWRKVGSKTCHEREAAIKLAFAQLWQLGYKLTTPDSLKDKHVAVLMNHWAQQGLVAGSLHTRLSYLRTFSGWLGKDGMVRDLGDYLPPERTRRTTVSTVSRAWDANGVDVHKVLSKALNEDEHFALYLALESKLGLRVKEAIEFNPAKSFINDEKIEIFQGTKGGRPRTIYLETLEQKVVFQWARDIADRNGTGRVRWPGLTWKQAQRRYYHRAEQLGITRSVLGVTSHGLRHQFAGEMYESETGGLPPPVRGGALGQVTREQHQRAAMNVSRALGHGRIDVFATYGGSYGHKLRTCRETEEGPEGELNGASPAG